MVPLNMTYLHCLQHSLFEHLFNLYLTLKETKLDTYGNTWDRSSANAWKSSALATVLEEHLEPKFWKKLICIYEGHFFNSRNSCQKKLFIVQWTVPQLSVMVIYYSTWSMLIQCIRVMIVRWQSELVIAKEGLLPVCDKPYHMDKNTEREEIGVWQNCALASIVDYTEYKI